ncbi:MAG: acyltransferase family protein [Halocynthiibacter sp.]
MRNYIPELDGLRAVAAIAVVAFHTRTFFASGGFLGVDVFFVLSGFLTMSILLSRPQPISAPDIGMFAVRRFRRLWPLLATVGLSYGVIFQFAGIDALGETLPAITFTANLAVIWYGQPDWLVHTWTLAVEMQFYLLIALLAWICARQSPTRLPQLLIIGFAAITATRVIGFYNSEDWVFGFYSPISHSSGLFLGALLACVKWRPSRGKPVLAGLSLGVILASFALAQFETGGALVVWITVTELAAAGLVLSLAGSGAGPVGAFLRLPWMRTLGLWSFGIYLWHYPIARLLRDVMPETAAFALTLLISIPLSALSYAVVEKIFLTSKTADPVRRPAARAHWLAATRVPLRERLVTTPDHRSKP